MLRSIKEILDYKLNATDGEIGKVHDFYFDDKSWVIRYLIGDTGTFFNSRYVLISPASLGEPDWSKKRFNIHLTKQKIKNSPTIDDHAPVSRQREAELIRYYEWPNYWMGLGVDVPPASLVMTRALAGKTGQSQQQEREELSDPHLRSINEVSDYYIHAQDGDLGVVDDFIVDDVNWSVRYMVIDTKAWLPWSKKVLISPVWIKDIDWHATKVSVDLSKKLIKNSPEFDPDKPVNKEYEARLYDYYGRPKYWLNE